MAVLHRGFLDRIEIVKSSHGFNRNKCSHNPAEKAGSAGEPPLGFSKEVRRSSQDDRHTQSLRHVSLAVDQPRADYHQKYKNSQKGRSAAAREIEPSSETRLGHHLSAVMAFAKRFGIGLH